MSAIDLAVQSYTARLAAAGSRCNELLTLLAAAPAGATLDELQRLVINENVTSKGSAAARTKVWMQLRQRYLLRDDAPEYAAFVVALGRTPHHADQLLLCYLLCARTDRLFRELTLDAVVPHLCQSGIAITSIETQVALDALLAVQNLHWTQETRETVRQHLLSALRDFGILLGGAKKRTARVHAGPSVAWYAARLAELEGRTARQVVESVWFRLLGLDQTGAVAVLREAAQSGLLAFRIQADVVELELRPVADWAMR